jgi:sulfite reductase (NADPH) hemoprotein beta-component
MKIVTAHILRTGEVVYRGKNGAWTPHLAEAAPFDDEHANDELAKAKNEATHVTNVYLVGIEGPGRPAHREYLRESIRAQGPSVRRDLGKQAEGG